MPLIQRRCAGCHAGQPSISGFTAPPLGVAFDDRQQVENQAQRIYQVAVATRSMPLGNMTGMTEDERELLAQWYAAQQKKILNR